MGWSIIDRTHERDKGIQSLQLNHMPWVAVGETGLQVVEGVAGGGGGKGIERRAPLGRARRGVREGPRVGVSSVPMAVSGEGRAAT